jgi:pimeloyl-ACP methyl ester carboxylesterase
MKDTGLKLVQVDGYSIAYREAGQGAALVLLHGFLCDSRCWERQLAGLSDHFRVVAWDAPGEGSSFDPPEAFTTSDYARCLAGFLDALGIRRAHVVGLSWGGNSGARVLPAVSETPALSRSGRHLRWLEGLAPGAGVEGAAGDLPA